MRISDWSSDVCSSDLQFDVLRACLAGQARVVTLLLADRRAGLATIVVRRVEQRVVGQREQTVRDRIPGREIGRASCREGVGKYVENSGVDVSLKKTIEYKREQK